MATTPQHCPGFSDFKHLKSFKCKCPGCGEEKEIFSDEFDKTHTCAGCGQAIDFTQCTLEGEA
jgi:ribosomal protein S27E